MIALLAGLIAQAALLLLLAPLLVGLVVQADTVLGLRSVRPVMQEYYDLRKWLRREPVRPPWGSALGALAPSLALGAALTAGLLVPTVVLQAPLAGSGDLVVFVALLALAQAAQALVAFETGDGLNVLRTGRDLAVVTIGEPILLLALLAASALAHSASLTALAAGSGLAGPARLAAFLAAAGVALLEGRRLARLRPATAFGTPILEDGSGGAAGRDHALVRWALLVRYLVILSVLAAAFLPWGLGTAGAGVQRYASTLMVGGALYVAKVLLLGLALRLADGVPAVLRHSSSGAVLAGAACCAVLALVLGGLFHA
jgi:formate hydrogenlyase subunit 4